MRWVIAVAILCIVVGLGGAAAFAAMPWILEKKLEWDCSAKSPGETCLIRMRAQGHIWSQKGNLVKAKRWYARAANHGDASAMFHLAWVYETLALQVFAEDLDGGRKESALPRASTDPEVRSLLITAANTYRDSAAKGFAPSMNNLGQMYLHGSGVNRDLKQAFKWSMAAARAGNPVGRLNVAIAYAAGHGVETDPAEAKKWRTWTPDAVNAADMARPTLERTRLFGSTLPAKEIEMLRAAVKLSEPVTMTFKPLQADPSLPTFNGVQQRLRQKREEEAQKKNGRGQAR